MSPLARKDLDTLLSTLNNPSTPKLQHQWQDNTYRMLLLSHPLWPTRKKTPSRVIHTFKAFPNALIYWLNPQTLSAPFRWNTHVTNLVKYLLHAPLTLCHNPLNSPPGSTRLSVYLPGIFPGGSKSSFCAFGTFFCRRKSSIELLFFCSLSVCPGIMSRKCCMKYLRNCLKDFPILSTIPTSHPAVNLVDFMVKYVSIYCPCLKCKKFPSRLVWNVCELLWARRTKNLLKKQSENLHLKVDICNLLPHLRGIWPIYPQVKICHLSIFSAWRWVVSEPCGFTPERVREKCLWSFRMWQKCVCVYLRSLQPVDHHPVIMKFSCGFAQCPAFWDAKGVFGERGTKGSSLLLLVRAKCAFLKVGKGIIICLSDQNGWMTTWSCTYYFLLFFSPNLSSHSFSFLSFRWPKKRGKMIVSGWKNSSGSSYTRKKIIAIVRR